MGIADIRQVFTKLSTCPQLLSHPRVRPCASTERAMHLDDHTHPASSVSILLLLPCYSLVAKLSDRVDIVLRLVLMARTEQNMPAPEGRSLS